MTRDEEQLAFDCELGWAIAQWASLENHLCIIAQISLTTNASMVVLQGFYAIENFRSKLAFVDATLRSKEPPLEAELIDRWSVIHDRFRALAQKRNQLAHRLTIEFLNPQDPPRPGKRFALVEYAKSLRERATIGPIPAGSYCVRDIAGIGVEFQALYEDLVNFSQALLGYPEPPQQSAQPTEHPPSLRRIRTRIHAKLGYQLPPSRRQRPAPGDAAAEQELQKLRSENK